MRNDDTPTVREMVKEAVEVLGGDTTNTAVRDWILRKYPGTNTSTIQCHIIACTVNHLSRIHYTYNRKPRVCHGPYDFLFRPERGRVVVYEPAKHGVWKIVSAEDGSLAVVREGEQPEPGESDEEVPTPGEGRAGFGAEAQLRDYLAVNLEAVEPGLQLYVDDYGNTGVEYQTPVGRIDLLAEDAEGGLLVIELKVERSPDKAVGQLLRYMGWVKRHLAEGKSVRGAIISQHVSDRLKYATADLQDVSLMEYELSVALAPVKPLSGRAS